jgi:hypothetical protein
MSNVESRIVAVVFNTIILQFPTQAELLYFEFGSGTGRNPPSTLTPISEACGKPRLV